MSERPILFSAPMVRAILAGKKTQTRRVVKAPKCATVHGRVSYPDKHFSDPSFRKHGPLDYLHWAYGGGDHGRDVLYSREMRPYGEPAWVCGDTTRDADRLWVRETWASGYARGCWGTIYAQDKSFGQGARSHEKGPHFNHEDNFADIVRWRPSIFMPRWASRITLVITDVRVERVQSITEADAKAEGVDDGRRPGSGDEPGVSPSHRYQFQRLWDVINGKRAPWAANPWVWVLGFRRITL